MKTDRYNKMENKILKMVEDRKQQNEKIEAKIYKKIARNKKVTIAEDE